MQCNFPLSHEASVILSEMNVYENTIIMRGPNVTNNYTRFGLANSVPLQFQVVQFLPPPYISTKKTGEEFIFSVTMQILSMGTLPNSLIQIGNEDYISNISTVFVVTSVKLDFGMNLIALKYEESELIRNSTGLSQ